MTHCPAAQQREDRIIERAQQIVARRWREPGEQIGYHNAPLLFALRMHGLEREVFDVAYLDNNGCLLSVERMFMGSLAQAEIHPREIVRRAMQLNAASVILSHNHPSGSTKPSAADRAVTRHVREALHLVGVQLLDHIIIGRGDPCSFMARGLL